MTKTVERDHARHCGNCKLCCKVFTIPEMHKLAGEWCPHCPTNGCGIYDSRPDICKQYKCVWLSRPTSIPAEFRPDKISVVFNEYCEGGLQLIEAHESHKGAFQKVQKEMTSVVKNGWGIVVCHTGEPHTVYPPQCETTTEREAWLRRLQEQIAWRCQIAADAVATITAERGY